MYFFRGGFLLALIVLSGFAQAQGDAARGAKLAHVCVKCHGVEGRSTDPTIPILEGQLADYIIAATEEFATGVRSNPAMKDVMQVFEKRRDLLDIAAYFSSRSPMKGKPSDGALAREGEELFTDARCNYCHFVGGKRFAPYTSNPPPPNVTGQHKAYLVKALHDIKSGRRPADPYGLMVNEISQLSDRQIEAIAEYLSGM